MRIPTAMEDSSVSHQNGQLGMQGGPIVNNKQVDETNQPSQYSIPGILHFIQHEWARFELERSQWDVDRAELQARIAFLQGERKGQENLKNDLVRRIKMLEYALKQERAKFHKLKFGVDMPAPDRPSGVEETVGDVAPDSEAPFSSVSNITWRQGRQLLRQYLQEIGYAETIIDVRSNRVRSLLGLNNNAEHQEDGTGGQGLGQNAGAAPTGAGGINGNGNETHKRAGDNQGRRTPAKKSQPSSMAEAMIMDSEAAVMANFEFLAQTDVDMSDDELSDELELETTDSSCHTTRRKNRNKSEQFPKDDVDAEAEEVLNELNLLTETEESGDLRSQGDQADWIQASGFQNANVNRCGLSNLKSDEENMDTNLGLGELAQLTVNNDAESSYDVSNTKDSFRKTWNAKYTLRSHFDGVRALAFHPSDSVLITASEDHTLKLWNLQKTVPAKKSASLDVEPLYTFRLHNGPVLCLTMSANGEQCYSGGTDGAINIWNVPSINIDPYDSYEPEVLSTTLEGHTDAVWGLSYLNLKSQLLSCSADGTVKLWSPSVKSPLLNSFLSEPDGIPSSVDFVRDDPTRVIAAYNTSHCVIFDSETGKQVLKLESPELSNSVTGKMIYKVVTHPTLPVSITAHEDRNIRFWDNNTGQLIHSMVAHLDAVTSLAVDPNGLYLLSGSHDCSIRLWNLDNKTCVQEITAHRKKFDESILDVAFHPSRPYIASAGADALAKVFV